MRRHIFGILCFVFALALFGAGCGGPDESAAPPTLDSVDDDPVDDDSVDDDPVDDDPVDDGPVNDDPVLDDPVDDDPVDDDPVDDDPVDDDPIDDDPIDDDPVDDDPVEPACPAEVDCLDTFPVQVVDTTVGGTRTFERYGCAPDTDEGGPERVYRVTIDEPGFFVAAVTDEADGADIDVHLLRGLDAADCLDRGHWTAGAALEPGVYWLVADSWVNGDGEELAGQFELSINLVTAGSFIELGLDPQLAEDALTVFSEAWSRGDSKRVEYAVTDFSMHAAERRQWIVDLSTGQLLWHLHVTHGENSIPGTDPGMAGVFSNIPESHQSSLGLVRTAETYFGDYGYSLRIDGLEPGFNDKVRDRAIVVHPWYGSDPDYIEETGYPAPSWGCPAIDPNVSADVIDRINGGALMLFWYPDTDWHQGSSYLP